MKHLKIEIKNCIYDSILKSYRKSPQYVCIDEERYLKEEKEFLDKIFSDPETRLKAKKTWNEDVISYILYNEKRNILHYCYTFLRHRHKGYAKALIHETFPATEPILISHLTKTFEYFFKKIGREYKYNPSLRYE